MVNKSKILSDLSKIAVDAMNSFITKHATTQADNRVIHHMFEKLNYQ